MIGTNIPMQIETISYRKRTVFDSMYRSNLTLWSMRIAFGLLAVLAIGSSAAIAYGAQKGKPVLSVFRANVGFVNSNTSNAKADNFDAVSPSSFPVPADYDGDGRMDFGTWDAATGKWQLQRSGDGSKFTIIWGNNTKKRASSEPNIAVPADFDGDGKADIAVWRPAAGEWDILNSSKNFDHTKATVLRWGIIGDVPVQADYDGDAKADIAVFRPSENRWYIIESKSGMIRTESFGIAGTDLLVPADYTGDGKADIAVYRKGTWMVLNSETGETEPFEFGFADARPVPGDYDGDGETDFAVFRKGTWYVYESSAPHLLSYTFGGETDTPLCTTMAKESIA